MMPEASRSWPVSPSGARSKDNIEDILKEHKTTEKPTGASRGYQYDPRYDPDSPEFSYADAAARGLYRGLGNLPLGAMRLGDQLSPGLGNLARQIPGVRTGARALRQFVDQPGQTNQSWTEWLAGGAGEAIPTLLTPELKGAGALGRFVARPALGAAAGAIEDPEHPLAGATAGAVGGAGAGELGRLLQSPGGQRFGRNALTAAAAMGAASALRHLGVPTEGILAFLGSFGLGHLARHARYSATRPGAMGAATKELGKGLSAAPSAAAGGLASRAQGAPLHIGDIYPAQSETAQQFREAHPDREQP